MNSVRQSCRPKHQVLILKCYPRFQKGVQDVKPNSSELSYLLYYASTRRTKLQKVGAFLEKRAARDVWRSRLGNVQVTLKILTALIEKLPRDLPLYAHSVLAVIETVLRSNDISMVEESISTFETFCSNQDLAVLAAEQQCASQYQSIIQLYAAFASPTSEVPPKATLSPPTALRWRDAGLKAIRSVVGSEALGTDGGKQLSIVVPVILENLYAGDEDVLVTLQMKAESTEKAEREHVRRRRTSTVTVQTVDTVEGNVADASGSAADADKAAELEVRLLALRCLERIFVVGSNRAQIRIAAGHVLQFVVSKHQIRGSEKDSVESGHWATSLMELIAKWCPVQDRFIVLFTALENLLDTPVEEERLQQHVILASLIDSLLKSPINMIGLSVIDVLLGFVQRILRLLQPSAANSPTQSPTQPTSTELPTKPADAAPEKPHAADHGLTAAPSATREKLVKLLQQCIGDLATHIYYGDQIADMIRTILKRIRPSTPSDMSPETVVRTLSGGLASTTNVANLAGERLTDSFFCSAAARITALEAVKNILVVANLRKATTGAGVESRNKVGIEVWEGTQWLLRDPDRRVRHAYADAFLSWLQLETTKSDLKVKGTPRKMSRSMSRREVAENLEKSARWNVSTSGPPVEKTSTEVASNFLQWLHLALYENAIESPTVESDILLIHLILVNSIEYLGVNAARYGVPMILKLQDDLATNEFLSSPDAQVNIGSLVYGYLAALSEKFDFETSNVGSDIQGEMLRRKNSGLWLEKIQLPPLALNQIVLTGDVSQRTELQGALSPFTAKEELVRQVENAYAASFVTAPQTSPPSSPGRSSGVLGSGQGPVTASSQQGTLPAEIREQMLSAWSKEACVAALERENTKASSLNGSRTAASVRRNYSQLNGAGNGSPTSAGSPATAHRHEHHLSGAHGFGSYGSLHGYRHSSGPEGSHTPLTSSSRDSTIRVNDLKRMLTVSDNTNVRRSSPLRGRLDATAGSVTSSSSESMISGTFSASDYENASSRPQSLREAGGRDGSETPRGSVVHLSNEEESALLTKADSDDIPPVPPLPPGLIPGGYPSDSTTSLSRPSSVSPVSDRPLTAPGPRKAASVKGKTDSSSAPRQSSRSMTARKSRSSTNLGGASLRKGVGLSVSDDYGHRVDSQGDMGDGRTSQRVEIEKLLDGIVSRGPAGDGSGKPSTETTEPRRASERRGFAGGIGRPPY
ncbi:hypothetical protein VTN77DRAFT_5818 [Rasamsonia byssochlamydoides]|uniref:uncharacterized protein n=1 Tax=Rasamsonia byssochlamydoides TaxID=89139 RepID=UPI00374413F0